MAKARKKRMHGVIKNEGLWKNLREREALENKSFEQLVESMFERYTTTSGEVNDVFYARYNELAKDIARVHGKPSLKNLMDLFWVLITRCSTGEYDINLVTNNVEGEIRIGKIRNPDFVEKSNVLEKKDPRKELIENRRELFRKYGNVGYEKKS